MRRGWDKQEAGKNHVRLFHVVPYGLSVEPRAGEEITLGTNRRALTGVVFELKMATVVACEMCKGVHRKGALAGVGHLMSDTEARREIPG